MAYLMARCPMLGCNHRNVVCDLHSESMPAFEPGIYVAVKCAHCGEIFREPTMRLELSHNPDSAATNAESGFCAGAPAR